MEIGEKAGLVKRSSRTGGETHFDLFRGRLMFPIVSTSGDVLGFGGRVLGDDEPKYLNSPETPVFHKGRVLYGLDVTARYIRSQDEAVIVEGYMDAVALYGAGLKNVAAILGTAFTPDHGKLIRRMTPNVLMLLDGDRAGIQGAERSLPSLLAADIRPRGLILPNGKDPDDFIREQGVDALKEQMDRAGDLFTLLLTRHWMAGYRATSADRLAVVEQAATALAPAGLGLLESPMADLFIEEMAKFLDVDSTWVRKTLTGKISALQPREHGPRPVPENRKSISSAQISSSNAIGVHAPNGPRETEKHDSDVENLEDSPSPDTLLEASDASEAPAYKRIDLEGISREEIVALGLLLQSQFLIQDLSEASKEWFNSGAARDEHPIAYLFEHDGARKLAGIALRKYGHQPDAFATLAASLMGSVAQPEILSKGLSDAVGVATISESSAEGDRRQMAKILNAIQRRRKQADLNRVSLELREKGTGEQSQELMERFMTIQRELREIENERRMFDRE